MSLFHKKKTDEVTEVAPSEVIEVTESTEETPTEEKAPRRTAKWNWKTNRKLRIGATATAVTAVAVAAVILLNVVVGILNDRFPLNLDLTADNTYTLSDESREVAQKVSQEVTITVFAQETQFSDPTYGNEMDVVLRQFYQFTNDYKTLTGGKVKVSYLDLDANPTLASAYEKYGVSSGSILFQCGEQWRTITLNDLYDLDDSNYYYTGEYSVSSLVEQKLASNINAVCGGKTITLTFLTGHGENEDAISLLGDLYELNGYTIQTTNFSTAVEIDKNAGALIIVAPSKDYTEDEITRLRAWLNNDGKRNRHLFVYCNYAASCPNLYEFLEVDYGITVTDKLILETDENNIPISYSGSYPHYPMTQAASTNLTQEMGSGTLLMPVTLQLITHKESDDATYSLTNHAMATFPESARLTGLSDLMGENATLDSIKQEKAESYPIVGMAYAFDYDYDSDNNELSNYVVVSGSYQMIGYIEDSRYTNEEMLLTPMRTVCSLGDTTVISGKDLATEYTSFTAMTALLLGVVVFTVGIPLVLVVIALVVFFKRRHL